MASVLVEAFEDTLQRIERDGALSEALARSIDGTALYLPGWRAAGSIGTTSGAICAEERGRGDGTGDAAETSSGAICVEERTSFEAARARAGTGERLAVLNFANPFQPGGGVTWGARAQEECLCRSSTLYPALNTPYLLEYYYGAHTNARDLGEDEDTLFSDRVIYTPGVVVFKDDANPPGMLPEPFETDIITCAAPYNCGALSDEAMAAVFEGRITQILEVAASRGAERLILGAFGCGAFHNKPALVAGVFERLLNAGGYSRRFREVVFAIRPARVNRNLDAFRQALGQNTRGRSFCVDTKGENVVQS